jgi:hypothetical protein
VVTVKASAWVHVVDVHDPTFDSTVHWAIIAEPTGVTRLRMPKMMHEGNTAVLIPKHLPVTPYGQAR